jgi:hypothetical protein
VILVSATLALAVDNEHTGNSVLTMILEGASVAGVVSLREGAGRGNAPRLPDFSARLSASAAAMPALVCSLWQTQ